MHIHLTTAGSKLRRQANRFRTVAPNAPSYDIPATKVEAITLGPGCNLTTDVLSLAVHQQIPVLLTDSQGRLVGKVWPTHYGTLATLRRYQALLPAHPLATQLVCHWVRRKVRAQERMLQRAYSYGWLSTRPLEAALPPMRLAQRQLMQLAHEPYLPATAQAIRGLEGLAARHYFDALAAALPPSLPEMAPRSRPAQDLPNALLNYGYGYLLGQCDHALHRAGLDPTLGLWHVDGHQRPSFTLDFMEPFRPWVDHAVWTALHQGHALEADLRTWHEPHPTQTGCWLSREGRQALLETLVLQMNQTIRRNGRRRSRLGFIELTARHIARRIETDLAPQPPYRQHDPDYADPGTDPA